MKGQVLPSILIGIFIVLAGLIVAENVSITGILNQTLNITQIQGARWLNTTEFLYINNTFPTFINTSINCTQLFGADADFCNDATGGDFTIDENLTVHNIFGNESVDKLTLFSNATNTDSYMVLNPNKQEFGPDISIVQFKSLEVNFTDVIDRNILQFNSTGVNIFNSLNIRNVDFLYPVGQGYKLIDHSPTVHNVTDTGPELILADFSPIWLYNISLNMGFGISSAMVFRPQFEPVGLPSGTDIASSSGAYFSPRFSDPSGNRTFIQLIGFISQPQILRNGTVATIKGISTNTRIRDNGTATNLIGVQIDNPIKDENATIGTLVGLKIQNQLAGSTQNFAIQSQGGKSYHIGPMVFNTSCDNPDHALHIGGTGVGCNTGTWSEINPGEASFTTSSSELIKENFAAVIEPNILDKVANVPIYTYDFKGYSYLTPELNMTTGKEYQVEHIQAPILDKMGFKAEEFYTIFGRNTNTSISGDEIMMAMWLSIQELIKENEQLKARLTALEP